MRAHLQLLARWSRLVLACLAVGSAVSPAQVASAAQAVTIVEGGPGKQPAAVVERQLRWVSARVVPSARARPVSRSVFVRGASRCVVPLFLLHRALLR